MNRSLCRKCGYCPIIGARRSIGMFAVLGILASALSSPAGEAEKAANKAAPKPKNKIITIATLGPRPISVDPQTPPQKIVDRIIAHWNARFAQVLPDKPDLIVVPEACDRPAGLSQEQCTEYYRVRGNQVQSSFAKTARENSCYVVYSAVREMPDGTWRNSCILLDRSGQTAGTYNKNFPTIGEMDRKIRAGRDAPIVECDFGRVAFAICFDLNFDELRNRYAQSRPDLIVFTSMYHGGLMQSYWAYSCRSHFVGAVAGLPCEIRNPLGEVMASSTNYFDFVTQKVNLDCALAHLDYNWERLRKLKAKYGPQVSIHDPGCLGSVLITSEHPSVTARDMIAEFEIEVLDDYLPRARRYREKPENRE